MVDRIGILDEVIQKSKHMTFKITREMNDGLPGTLRASYSAIPGKTNVELEIELPDLKKMVTMAVERRNQSFRRFLRGLTRSLRTYRLRRNQKLIFVSRSRGLTLR